MSQDGTWPRSREEAALQFGYLGRELVTKIARGNAIKLLGLDLPVSRRREPGVVERVGALRTTRTADVGSADTCPGDHGNHGEAVTAARWRSPPRQSPNSSRAKSRGHQARGDRQA